MTTSLKKDSVMLFLASILSLYVELLLIRYAAIEIHIFADFKNLVLMSCFLGLGLLFALLFKKVAKPSEALAPCR